MINFIFIIRSWRFVVVRVSLFVKIYYENINYVSRIVEPEKNNSKPSNAAVKKSFQSAEDDDDIKFFGI